MTKVNVRSSKIVISTGTIVPRWDSVAALYSLQKSMMATPCGPSAVPTGGAGVAWPAGIWILTTAMTFFLAMFTVFDCCRASLRRDESVCRRGPASQPVGEAAGGAARAWRPG